MQAHVKIGNITLVVEGAGQKEVFKKIGEVQEVFGQTRCGACGGSNLRYVERKNGKHTYYELRCLGKQKDGSFCRAKLEFGQHDNDDKTLYPKRKAKHTDKDYLPNNGWTRYEKPEE